jgi:hypothetical protein
MHIFVHHEGALGDVLLSLPCLRRIAADGTVHFAGRPDVGSLLRELCLAGEASASGAARYAPLQAGTAEGGLKGFLAQFERAVVFTADPTSPLVRAVRGAVPATTAVDTVPPEGAARSAALFRLSQCGAEGPVPGMPLLPVPPLHRDLARGMLGRAGHDGTRPLLAVHPGSGGPAKRWPLENFLAAVGLLRERIDPFCLFLSGPAEDDAFKDRLDRFVRGRSDAVHYAGADLIAVAALLAGADLYLGNDSGVTHLAAAVGCPVVALFGPTDPAVWGPVGSAVTILREPDLSRLSVGAVAAAVAGILSGGKGGRGAP